MNRQAGAAALDAAVIVCSRNRPQKLARALKFVLANSPQGIQVLVVDSASDTDETRRVCLEAGVDYVRTEIPGLSIARNVGLTSVTAEIVVFTDDDCEPWPLWIENVTAPFCDDQVAVVTGRVADQLRTPSAVRFSGRTLAGLDLGHGALMAMRRTAVLATGGFDPVLGAGRRLAGAEDLDMFCRLLRAGWDAVHQTDAVVAHTNVRRDAAHRGLLYGYGLGLGALAAKYFRLERRLGLTLGAVVLTRTVRRALRSTLRHSEHTASDWAQVGGVLYGALIAARYPVVGETFVDVNPPRKAEVLG
ncbi:glycosyltransferase [Arthrobacter sp. ISL-48]|uniref:glycosyltransferase family 2 protein n=1 Tax=Arthrobacter sp. ISL-48 TaxID=2819110 RepID=UPI001BEC9E24|nr:glycosyltransferase [Arthrobacter sp. ISL-48]MBT2534477.1 glycosyltransferase [Arthrobacter sp. ISL-48]